MQRDLTDRNKKSMRITVIKSVFVSLIFVIYTVLLFVSTTMKVPSDILLSPGIDKIIHFTQFFIFALLLFFLLNTFKIIKMFIIGSIIGIFMSIFFEYSQLSLNYRTFSYYDMLANILGFIIGMGVYRWIFYRQ